MWFDNPQLSVFLLLSLPCWVLMWLTIMKGREKTHILTVLHREQRSPTWQEATLLGIRFAQSQPFRLSSRYTLLKDIPDARQVFWLSLGMTIALTAMLFMVEAQFKLMFGLAIISHAALCLTVTYWRNRLRQVGLSK